MTRPLDGLRLSMAQRKYAMVEKTRHIADGDYPSKATTIFYKNGPTVELNEKGMPYLTSSSIGKDAVLHGSGNE